MRSRNIQKEFRGACGLLGMALRENVLKILSLKSFESKAARAWNN